MYEQPLAGPSMTSQWSGPYPTTSVDKGKARATDQTPSPHPESTGEDGEWTFSFINPGKTLTDRVAWRYPQLHATQDYGIQLPHTVSHFARLIEVVSLTAILPGSRCTTKYRRPNPYRLLFWASAVQSECEGEGEGDAEGQRQTETRSV